MEKAHFYSTALKSTVHRINENCWVIHDYTYGKPQVKVNLVIWKAKKNKSRSKKKLNLKYEYFLYITSRDIPATSVYSLYGTRWRIKRRPAPLLVSLRCRSGLLSAGAS